MIGESVTVIRKMADGEDSMGNPAYTNVEIVVPGCAFAPGGSGEDVSTFGVRIGTDGTLYDPSGTLYLPHDVLIIRGDQYVVDGRPAEWTNPYANDRVGVVVGLKRSE